MPARAAVEEIAIRPTKLRNLDADDPTVRNE